MGKYKIYVDRQFAVTKLTPGKRSFDEVIELATKILEDRNFPIVKNHIIDLRGCELGFESHKLKGVYSLLKENEEKDNQISAIYLSDNPITTAYVQLYASVMGSVRDYCLTLEKAYDMASVDFSYDEFVELLNI